MSNQQNGQHWHNPSQYAYAPQGNYPGQLRQTMILIPQPRPDELMNFYNDRGSYNAPPIYQQQSGYPQQPQHSQLPSHHYGVPGQMQQPNPIHAQPHRDPSQASQHSHAMYHSHGYGSQVQQQYRTVMDGQSGNGRPQLSQTSVSRSHHQVPPGGQAFRERVPDARSRGKIEDSARRSDTLSQPPPPRASSQGLTGSQSGTQTRPERTAQVVIPKKQSAAAQFNQAFGEQPPTTSSQKKPVKASHPSASASPTAENNKSLLIALAHEYISAARSMTTGIASAPSEQGLLEYRELMQMGLTCLHTVIRDWKVGDAKTLISLRLQYATLLHEETEDDNLAQSMISQGITACERSKLIDQKCSFQHLSARIHFPTKPKAAFKIIDGALEDVLAYDNVPWIYAFRLLRVTLAMQNERPSEVPATLHQLKQLMTLSEARGDIAVLVMANVLEALVQSRLGTVEAFEQAQRAVAAAQKFQLHPQLQEIPQLKAMVSFVDLSCDLLLDQVHQLGPKLKVHQDFVDELGQNGQIWQSGVFNLPTSISATSDISGITSGILRKQKDKICLNIRWINKVELTMLAFLFSGVAELKNSTTEQKAQQFFKEGIEYAKKTSTNTSRISKTLDAAVSSTLREGQLTAMLQLHRLLALINLSEWAGSAKMHSRILDAYENFLTPQHHQLLTYLNGMIKHGSGDLSGASAIYSSERLVLSPSHTGKTNKQDLDLRLLAATNRALILLSSPGTVAEGEALRQHILAISNRLPDKSIQSAVSLLRSIPHQDLPVIDLKQYVQGALALAQKAKNNQLIGILLAMTFDRFFAGVVAGQALHGARVAHQCCRKTRSPLWMSVGGKYLSDCLTLQGRHDEAGKARQEATTFFSRVPAAVQDHLAQAGC